MRRQLVQTNRSNHNQQSQIIEVIPRNDRLLSPKSDKSLERRSKSIHPSELLRINATQEGTSQTNPITTVSQFSVSKSSSSEIPGELRKSMIQFVKEIQELKSENRQLVSQNQILSRENDLIRNAMEHDIRQSKQSRESECSIKDYKNGYLESYYTRIKAIQERVQYYQAQSKANQIYSNCLIEISKCISSEQMTVEQLKKRIMNLMEECQSYKQEIRRLDEVCRTKQHNTNQQLQKIIMDFNETVFIKNQLQIKIFDLGTENNSLRTNVYQLNCKLQQQQLDIQRMNSQLSNLNTHMSTSQYQSVSQNLSQQMRLNLEHLNRQNQHLKMQISTFKTKVQHYHGSQFSHKQQITRLNNFIVQLNTKWSVQFEHNGILQEERKSHLRQITRLGAEVQRLNSTLQESRSIQTKLKIELDSAQQSKRILQRQLENSVEEIRLLKQTNMQNSNLNESSQNETKSLRIKIEKLNEVINEITRASQNKQNNYLDELNSLRQQIQHLIGQCNLSQNHIINKQEQMRIMRQQIIHQNSIAMENIANQSRLQIQRERSHHNILNQKINDLQNKIQYMHKQGLQYQSEISSKKNIISDLDNNLRSKTIDYDNEIRRLEASFHMQREKMLNTKNMLQSQLQIRLHHIQQLENSMYRMKQSQIQENQSLNLNNTNLQRKNEECERVIQNMKSKIAMLQSVQIEKNRLQIDCSQKERELNNRATQMQLFIVKTNEEQSIRSRSYQDQIKSFQQMIEQAQRQKRSMRLQYEQQMHQMSMKQSEMQQSLLKQTFQLEQEAKTESYLKTVISQLKSQYQNQIEALRNELVMNSGMNRSQIQVTQLQNIISRCEQRFINISKGMEKLAINERKSDRETREMERWFNMEVANIRDRCIQEVNKTKKQMNDFINNQRMMEKNNNVRVLELENKLKSCQIIIHQQSIETNNKINREKELNWKTSTEIQRLAKQNQALKQSNIRLSCLLATAEQTNNSLRNQLSNSSSKYQKFKSESQAHEDILLQQIRSLKLNISEIQKQNIEITTKAGFTEHDRTLDRLTSLPDLNISTRAHNRSTIQMGRNIINPEILFIDQKDKVKSFSNRLLQRTVSPGAQVVVNIIQKPLQQQQKMTQPSRDVRSTSIINRNFSPRNERSFGIAPLILNEQPVSPTHRLCFAQKRRSISPHIKVAEKVEYVKSPRQEDGFISRREEPKFKQVPLIPIERAVMSPKPSHVPLKPSSPPTNMNNRVCYRPQGVQPIIHFPNSSFCSKPTSPNPKQGKLSVTLMHSNIKASPKDSSGPQDLVGPSDNSNVRYCC